MQRHRLWRWRSTHSPQRTITMKLIELIEARARAVAAMRSYHEAGDEAKFNEIDTEVVALDAKISNLRKIEAAETVQSAFGATRQPEMENIGGGNQTSED